MARSNVALEMARGVLLYGRTAKKERAIEPIAKSIILPSDALLIKRGRWSKSGTASIDPAQLLPPYLRRP